MGVEIDRDRIEYRRVSVIDMRPELELQDMRREQASSLVIPDAGGGLGNPNDVMNRGGRTRR